MREESAQRLDCCGALFHPKRRGSDTDNWRGISHLGVVGMVVAKVLQKKNIAVEELHESQYGFRARRGCSDMIFTVWKSHMTIERHPLSCLLI